MRLTFRPRVDGGPCITTEPHSPLTASATAIIIFIIRDISDRHALCGVFVTNMPLTQPSCCSATRAKSNLVRATRTRTIVGCVVGGRGRSLSAAAMAVVSRPLAPLLHVTAHDHALGKLLEPLESIHLGTEGGRLH